MKRILTGALAAMALAVGISTGTAAVSPQSADAFWACSEGRVTYFMVHDGVYKGYIRTYRPC